MAISERNVKGALKTVKGQGTSNGTSGSKVLVKAQTVTVNVFFDGTGNNRYNIDDRRKHPGKYSKNMFHESYFDDYSNVALLFNSRVKTKIPQTSWVYIEGIGTGADDINEEDRRREAEQQAGKQTVLTKEQQAQKEQEERSKKRPPDSTRGCAVGSGPTGITERVDQTFEKIQRQVRSEHGTIVPAVLRLNVFGFSRGAAAARHFVHLAKTQPHRFNHQNLRGAKIAVGFVGLFDTVSSFHPWFTLEPETKYIDLFKDVAELHLNFKKGYADKVFQITAHDEYRKYFSLTTIQSAVDLGFGIEVALNGAHADIGGSYPDNGSEYFEFNGDGAGRLKNWLVQRGFYTEKQVVYQAGGPVKSTATGAPIAALPAVLRVSRSGVSNHYHKVPFKAMRLMAEKYGRNIAFEGAEIKKIENSPHGEIKKLLDSVPADILRLAAGGWGKTHNLAFAESYAKTLRGRFIHWSPKNKTGHDLRLKDGLPYRKTYPG